MTGMFSATKPVKEAENDQGVRRSARHAASGAASVLEQAQARRQGPGGPGGSGLLHERSASRTADPHSLASAQDLAAKRDTVA